MARATKKTKELTLEEKLDQALVPEKDYPYTVPSNWCWAYLGKTVALTRGSSPRPIKAYLTSANDGVNWIKIGDTDESKYINATKEKITPQGALKSVAVHKGDLLLTNSMSYGKPFILNIDGYIHDGWFALTPLGCFNKDYLYYSCLASKWYFDQIAVGTAVRNISSDRTATTPLVIAPLAEQQRIVDRIESIFAKLDEAKEKAQEVVDGFELRKSAILHKAFTGELTSKWREENGLKMDSWIKSTIGEQFTHATGKALKKTVQEGSLHKYITTSNLYWGTFDFSEVREMYFKEDELEKYTATKGDLLICNGGDVGRAAIWNYDYDICLQNHVSKLRKKNQSVDITFFFYYFLFSKINGNISGKGIGIASLSAKTLLAMEVNLPTFCEQQEIANMLDKLFAKEQQAKDAAEAVLEQIDTMKKAVLARAFRGELGTNDPAEESAVELLKTIL